MRRHLTPDQDRINEAAIALYRVLEESVPSTTVDYAVEDARRAAAALVVHAHDVVTVDVKERRAPDVEAAKVILEAARRAYGSAHDAYQDVIHNPISTAADINKAFAAFQTARTALNQAEGKS